MTHVVITNGAPFTGKDTLVKFLLENYSDKNVKWARFKDILYKESYKRLTAYYDDRGLLISLKQWIDICNHVILKDKKLPYDLSNIEHWITATLVYNNHYGDQLSPRNELIHESEDNIKVKYGAGGVAVLTAKEIKNDVNWKDKTYFFSDGGFNIEIDVLKEELELTDNDITIVRIDADGCSYKNDSREYINNPNFKLFNKKDESFLTTEIFDLLEHLDKII